MMVAAREALPPFLFFMNAVALFGLGISEGIRPVLGLPGGALASYISFKQGDHHD